MPDKKNTINQYISNAQAGIQLILTIASVVTILASLWIATKLAPFAEDISILYERAEAQDRRQTEINTTLQGVQDDTSQIKTDVAEIKGFLKARN